MIRSTALAALAATAVLTLAACGSDAKISIAPTTTAAPAGGGSGATVPGGSGSGGAVTTIPTGAIPGGTGNCAKLAQEWAAAIGGAATGQVSGDNVFKGLEAAVPDSLKADAKVLAEAYTKLITIMTQYKGDITKAMSDPAAQAAIQSVGTPEVQAASKKISAYFDGQCKG